MAYSSSFKVTGVTLVAGAAAVKVPTVALALRNLLKLIGSTGDAVFYLGDQPTVNDSGSTMGAPIPPGQPGTDFMPLGPAVDVYAYAPAGGPNIVVTIWEYAE